MIRDESPFPCMYVYLVGAHTRERGRISFDVEYPYFLRFRQYRSYNVANSAWMRKYIYVTKIKQCRLERYI
jgi:hypothetical protein